MERTAERSAGAEQVRCPYCHDAIVLTREDWIACKECLARHHVTCWHEGTSCSSCRAPQFLRRPRPVPDEARRASPRTIVLLAATLVLGVTGAVREDVLRGRARDEIEKTRAFKAEAFSLLEAERAKLEEARARRESVKTAGAALEVRPRRPSTAEIDAALRTLGQADGRVVEKITAVVQANPRFAHALAARALARRHEGDGSTGRAPPRSGTVSSGREDVDAALAIDPACALALGERAWHRVAAGDEEGAREDADRALALDPHVPGAWAAKARLAFARGDFVLAAFAAQEVLGATPAYNLTRAALVERVDLLVLRGKALLADEQVWPAMNELRTALQLDPVSLPAALAAADAAVVAGRPYEGATVLEAFLRAQPPLEDADVARKRLASLRER